MSYSTYYHEASYTLYEKVPTSKSIEVQPIKEAAEIQADIKLNQVSVITFSGVIYNEKMVPVCGESVKIIKPCTHRENTYFELVACTTTDQEGHYKVEVYGEENQLYVIIEGCKILPIPVDCQEEKQTYCVEHKHWKRNDIKSTNNSEPMEKKGIAISDYQHF
ncbi:MAG: hypothetical protein RR448_00605 [Niameybacter sp.]|uniref:hypothetical protein n=1 Tax=Niameybacter sp. TaxID=2033640 RepID=UPI002FC9B8A3